MPGYWQPCVYILTLLNQTFRNGQVFCYVYVTTLGGGREPPPSGYEGHSKKIVIPLPVLYKSPPQLENFIDSKSSTNACWHPFLPTRFEPELEKLPALLSRGSQANRDVITHQADISQVPALGGGLGQATRANRCLLRANSPASAGRTSADPENSSLSWKSARAL